MFAHYGHPVYLVGSALTEKWPRDIDVRVWLPDEEYAARYHSWNDQSPGLQWPDPRKKWAEEMGKNNSIICRLAQLNVDFQAIPMSEVTRNQFHLKPRVRLDTVTQVKEEIQEKK